MAQSKDKNGTKLRTPAEIINREARYLRFTIWFSLIFALVANIGAFYYFNGASFDFSNTQTIVGLVLSSFAIILAGGIILWAAGRRSRRMRLLTQQAIDTEISELRAADKRAKSLQNMASTLRATLSFERVVDAALDVCAVALEDMGIPSSSLVGAVLLFESDVLVPVAQRRLTQTMVPMASDTKGIIGESVANAEPAVTKSPRQDPGLNELSGFRKCYTVTSIPLRAGFQMYGVMLIGSEVPIEFDNEFFDLFAAVSDQAVIALQNAQLFQDLEAEKQRLIEAETEARKNLARDLHDGPTQSIAAIAMRINFIKSVIDQDRDLALTELDKVEDLSKATAKEIRGMLFTLRPLVLETKGLASAIETVMSRIRETDGLNMRLVGGEYSDLLNQYAQSVVFNIVEEALGNARKHSKASLIEVRFWTEDNLFAAQIKDDGVGFDVAEVTSDYSSRGSLGMINMQERADMIDGRIQLESAPGAGTEITLVVPLDRHGR